MGQCPGVLAVCEVAGEMKTMDIIDEIDLLQARIEKSRRLSRQRLVFLERRVEEVDELASQLKQAQCLLKECRDGLDGEWDQVCPVCNRVISVGPHDKECFVFAVAEFLQTLT